MAQTALFNAAPVRRVLGPHDYAELLQRLAHEAPLYSKCAPIYAYSLEPKLVIVTTQPDGREETRNDVLTSGLYLVFDAAKWPDHTKRMEALREIFISIACKMADEKHWNEADWRGPDAWTLRRTSLQEDYVVDTTDAHLWHPSPNAERYILRLDEHIRMPVLWGTFDVDAGGAIAIRARHRAALLQALDDVAHGRLTAEEALYTSDTRSGTAQTVSRFDVYGMYPGFLEKNYVQLCEAAV